MTTKTPLFEHRPCGRCGGSGHYSYCPGHGTRCFGCGGSGITYTTRGARAAAYLEKLLTVTTAQLEVGRKVRYTSVTIGGGAVYTTWATVESVTQREDYPDTYHVVVAERNGDKCTISASADTEWRIMPKQHEFDSANADALAYQNTLTKTGTPRKNQQKSAA